MEAYEELRKDLVSSEAGTKKTIAWLTNEPEVFKLLVDQAGPKPE